VTSSIDEIRAALPDSLGIRQTGSVLRVTLQRPAKRNALDDATVLGLDRLFGALPDDVQAVVLAGDGDHFCAGLDLSELKERDATAGLRHSMMWHRAFEKIQFGPVPVIAVLKGAVIGGGLELACAAHIRVAERSAFYALPEGQRGIFVGGGASVRLPRLIGASRMMEMMLTGRAYGAEDGAPIGFSHYLVDNGQGDEKAQELADKVSRNAPMTNLALLQVFPRIVEADPATGFVTESLMAAIAQSDDEAKSRMRDFLERRAGKVERPPG
jgi:enoyl-CoA hydratase/carnithine racemase